ncbi:uncharacterized protein TEOVI_000483400 [Trypanosoma equiperdum]|uniref:Trypanosome variant surface glycoprotein (A-type) n=1 Tax=Trypanosoma equiperdum TaxID=5694 RepID=A0A1G4HYI7_TRYEQ|nr:hypothetical protein, conserved [Trypanosoma equiperdum]
MLQLQPRHWRSTLIVHALILLIAICVGGQSSSDPSKVSNVWTETWYVNKLITNLKERATTASNRAVEKNSQNVKLFQLAANRHANDKKGDGYAALAAMVEFENQKVAQQAVLFEQAHFDALHKLAHRAGAAALRIAISTMTKGQITGKGTVEANGGTTILAETDDKHCKVTQEVALATKLNCDEQKTNQVDATKEADKTATWDKILLRQRSELTKIAVDTRILVKGAGADIGGNPGALSNEPGCSDNSGHTTIAAATNAVVAGVKSFAAIFKATPMNLPATGEGREAPQAPNDGGDEIELLVPDEKLEKALKTAFKQPIPVATDISTLKTTQVLSTPAVQAFAKALAAKNKGKATASLSD